MKHKITWKLIGYFAAVLLLFAIGVSVLFTSLFGQYTIAHHEDDLLLKASSMARTISAYLFDDGITDADYNRYLKLVDGLVTSDVWILDKDAQTINVGEGTLMVSYDELPHAAESVIQQVFDGNVTTSQDFSSLLEKPSLTIGMPVTNPQGEVIAALLLHSSIEGTQEGIAEGLRLLIIASIAALAVAVLFAVLLSMHFIRPIRAMQIAANYMAQGDYRIATGVHRKDELGALAEDLDTLAIRLEKVSEESEKLEQMRRDFVSNVSHELRTPVTVLRSSLEAICEGVVTDPEQVKEYHDCMLTETLHLQRMIADLLELSRLQNTDFTIAMTKTDLTQAACDALRAAQQLAQAKCILLVYQEPTTNAPILADSGRIRQLILILLDNGIKFSPEGSKVELSIQCEGDQCVMTVADQGEGIAQEDLPYIFERFYKASDTINPHGTGLGLCIAKQIALRHNAELWAENLPEKGCKFTVRFQTYLVV